MIGEMFLSKGKEVEKMKDYSKRIYLSVFWCALGIALFILSLACDLDSFWCGLGCALGVIGFKIAGNIELSNFCGIAVGVLALFYWTSWIILSRKY